MNHEAEHICKTCLFWVAAANQPRNPDSFREGEGECRRRAPTGGGITAYLAAGKAANRMIAPAYPWPVSHEGDWCGEYVSVSARD